MRNVLKSCGYNIDQYFVGISITVVFTLYVFIVLLICVDSKF